jgi:hypothetical protein
LPELGSSDNERDFPCVCFHCAFRSGVIDVIGRYFAPITLGRSPTDCFCSRFRKALSTLSTLSAFSPSADLRSGRVERLAAVRLS